MSYVSASWRTAVKPFKLSKPYCAACGKSRIKLIPVQGWDTAGQHQMQWLCDECFVLSEIMHTIASQVFEALYQAPEDDPEDNE